MMCIHRQRKLGYITYMGDAAARRKDKNPFFALFLSAARKLGYITYNAPPFLFAGATNHGSDKKLTIHFSQHSISKSAFL